MPQFTPDQLELIARKRKSAGNRPRIFRKATGALEEISLDFEAFLILAPDTAKATSSLFINVLLQNLPSPGSRFQVLIDVLINEFTNAASLQTSVTPFLLAFDNVKRQFNPGPFQDLPEIQQFFDDLSFSFGPFASLDDYARYSLGLVARQTLVEVAGFGEGSIQQNLRSYIAAINAYR